MCDEVKDNRTCFDYVLDQAEGHPDGMPLREMYNYLCINCGVLYNSLFEDKGDNEVKLTVGEMRDKYPCLKAGKHKAPVFDLDKFSKMNYDRCVVFHDPLTPEDWDLAQWSNAVAGEVGEACNVTKKILRLDHNIGMGDKPREDLINELKDEIADVFAYLDLLATVAGINLGEAIIRKFNRVSAEKGVDIFYK